MIGAPVVAPNVRVGVRDVFDPRMNPLDGADVTRVIMVSEDADERTEATGDSVIAFESGIPGFPAARHFTLVPWGTEDSPFSVLQCLDQQLELVVMLPDDFFPDYSPEIDDETVERLGLVTADDALVLVIVTVPDNVEQSTANLLGPIVINRHTRAALQVVLSEAWSTRRPLLVSA